MVFKSLIITAALFVGFTAAQYPPWDDGDSIDGSDDELPEQQCNETVCHIPCEGAGPPAVCPLNVPECPSGCACYLDCSTNTLTCFMTKYCTKIRRFLTKRRHARAVSQDVDLSLSKQTQTVAQTPPAFTVVQTNKQRVEQNRTTSTDHGIRRRGKQDSSTSTVTQNNSDRVKQALSASSSTQSGRVERDIASSTVTQVVTQSTGKYIVSTVVQSTGGRVERELSISTVAAPSQETSSIEYATFRAQSDAITLAKPINIDYKRLEKEAEKAAELKVKKAAEKSAEKAAEGQKKKTSAKAKMANAGAGVVADVATGCVVLFACIYRCLGSLLPGNP